MSVPAIGSPLPPRRSFLSFAAGGLLLALLFPAPARSAPEDRAGRLNLVLITVSSLRADRLGCYGGPAAVRTPAIDALAASGVRFERVVTPSVCDLPPVATLLTGQTAHQHQVWDDDYRNRLSPSAVTLAERLRDAGYRTGAFVGTSRLAAQRGFDQGFGIYQDDYTPPPNGTWSLVPRGGRIVVGAAKAWLQGLESGPFFLWVNIPDPMIPGTSPPDRPDPQPAESYAKRVAEADAVIGDLMAALEAAGMKERTVVVLTADHGLGLGDHGELRAGLFLYESTVRVPLIIRPPDGGLGKGSRIAATAGLIDLYPTLEKLLGLPSTPGLTGRDLLGSPPATPPAYQATARKGAEAFGWAPSDLVASGSWRLIRGRKAELYDISADPGQDRDLAARRPETVRSLSESALRLAGGKAPPPFHFLSEAPVPEDLASRLVALGYAPASLARAKARALPDPRRIPGDRALLEDMHLRWEVGKLRFLEPAADAILRAEPEGHFPLLTMAELKSARGDAEGVEAGQRMLRAAQKLFPRDSQVYHLLGHLAFPRQKYGEAELFLRIARALGPPIPSEVAYDLACAHSRQNRVDPALVELKEAIRLGFRDAAHIRTDPDLEPIRSQEAFKRLMTEEFRKASGS